MPIVQYAKLKPTKSLFNDELITEPQSKDALRIWLPGALYSIPLQCVLSKGANGYNYTESIIHRVSQALLGPVEEDVLVL